MHVARTDDLTHFAYDSRRGQAAMQEVGILPQSRGTLVRDGYLSYSRFEACRHGLCNAHLLRELVYVEETDSKQKVWTQPLAALLVEIKQKIGGCFRTAEGARDFCRVRSYLSTARKQSHPLLHALERVLSGKPLAFSRAAGNG